MNEMISRERTLNNELLQGSVIAPALFDLYIADLPAITAQKLAYADDLAISVSHKFREITQKILEGDLYTLDNITKNLDLYLTRLGQNALVSI